MFLKLLFACFAAVEVRGTSYDQSQMGDLNVQVDLKDLRIIALMKEGKEEYVDYDYAYDYSEMTIKPQNGTTPKPLNTTSSTTQNALSFEDNNSTSTTAAFIEDTTVFNQNVTSMDNAQATNNVTAPTAPIPTSIAESISSGNLTDVTKITANNTAVLNSTNNIICKKGFVLNQKGDCELKIQGGGNALLKLVKLSQKLKLRRERRTTVRG